jgi:hypothetical protein
MRHRGKVVAHNHGNMATRRIYAFHRPSAH